MIIIIFFCFFRMNPIIPTEQPDCSDGSWCSARGCYVHSKEPYVVYKDIQHRSKNDKILPAKPYSEEKIIFQKFYETAGSLVKIRIPRLTFSDGSSYELTTNRFLKTAIYPNCSEVFSTGIKIAKWPKNTFCHVSAVPFDAAKFGIFVSPSVIEGGYKGEIIVNLFNSHPKNMFVVEPGKTVAHLTFAKAHRFNSALKKVG